MIEENTKKVYVCYLDDNDEKIEGFFELVEKKENYVEIKSGRNIITLPYHRIRKIKDKIQN